MEEDGLVLRQVYAEIPLRVEYSLTALGEKCVKSLTLMPSLVTSIKIISVKSKIETINKNKRFTPLAFLNGYF